MCDIEHSSQDGSSGLTLDSYEIPSGSFSLSQGERNGNLDVRPCYFSFIDKMYF